MGRLLEFVAIGPCLHRSAAMETIWRGNRVRFKGVWETRPAMAELHRSSIRVTKTRV